MAGYLGNIHLIFIENRASSSRSFANWYVVPVPICSKNVAFI